MAKQTTGQGRQTRIHTQREVSKVRRERILQKNGLSILVFWNAFYYSEIFIKLVVREKEENKIQSDYTVKELSANDPF